jgi:DNA replication protein DnaC
MTNPTRMIVQSERLTRTGKCEACSTEIQQEGIPLGEHALWNPHWCPDCTAGRQLASDQRRLAREAEDEAERRFRERERIARAVADLKVPPAYLDVTLQSFQLHGDEESRKTQMGVVRKGIRYAGSWPDVPDQMLVLRGSFGTGKGHWAWSVVKGIVGATGATARVVKCSDLVRRLRASWGQPEGAESETDALKFYRDLDLLVIDEVSSHAFYGQGIHQHLYDVLDHRGEWHRPTIMTTNESDAGLEAILRPALIDRLQYRGGILEFGTASYRALAR